MADWAYNSITVETKNKEHLKAVYELLLKYTKNDTRGHSPLDHTDKEWDHTFMFDISFDFDVLDEEVDYFVFHCDSKYGQPEDTLKHLSELFDLTILCHTQEIGGKLYGETLYYNGEKLMEVMVPEDKFCETNDDDQPIHPETGEVLESEYTYYDEVLDKIKEVIKNAL